MITLVLEASTYLGSTALFSGSRLLGELDVAMRGRDHEALMPAAAALMREHEVAPGALGRIACGAGPGAFTSLRIAGSIAKGLALASGAPVVAISSLALIVASLADRPDWRGRRYLAVSDAMRGESYSQLFSVNAEGRVTESGGLELITSARLHEMATALGVDAFGPQQPEPHRVTPRAGMMRHLETLVETIPSVDLASWEPAYGRLAEAQVKWEAVHGRPLHPAA